MHREIPPRLQTAINALLTERAASSPKLRQAVMEYAGNPVVNDPVPSSLPADLAPFVNKVSLYAYRVTDGDIEQLKAAGYSEDEIFELTLCAAVGAGLVRLECGLAALEGAR